MGSPSPTPPPSAKLVQNLSEVLAAKMWLHASAGGAGVKVNKITLSSSGRVPFCKIQALSERPSKSHSVPLFLSALLRIREFNFMGKCFQRAHSCLLTFLWLPNWLFSSAEYKAVCRTLSKAVPLQTTSWQSPNSTLTAGSLSSSPLPFC